MLWPISRAFSSYQKVCVIIVLLVGEILPSDSILQNYDYLLGVEYMNKSMINWSLSFCFDVFIFFWMMIVYYFGIISVATKFFSPAKYTLISLPTMF